VCLLVLLGLTACGAGGSSDPNHTEALPPVTVAIYLSLHPNPPNFFDEDESVLLPLAVIADTDGEDATFVANRLIVQTDDQAALNALLGRYGGQMLEAIHPAADGMPDLPSLYLIEVNVNTTTFDALAADLTALGGDEEGVATGHHLISSVEGAKLLAIAAGEALSITSMATPYTDAQRLGFGRMGTSISCRSCHHRGRWLGRYDVGGKERSTGNAHRSCIERAQSSGGLLQEDPSRQVS
jgi:hypothetical protein